ncbi:MAG TPA: phosphoribosylanthranilate isomerase [Kofleriaceae bacterium]|nr:phosphoribosylanthranilate isomerase [Kofleriaceae bacterium]
MTRIKVCGVTLPDDAARVAAAGADFIGFNFWPKSKRYVAPERAPMLAAVARGSGAAKLVGVFVDPDIDEVLAITTRVDIDIIQLHGDETPDFVKRLSLSVYRPVWKAIPVASSKDIQHLDIWSSEAILLDAPTPGRGGAGAKFDWNLAREARERFPRINIILAGGLNPENVTTAIQTVEPWAVDVASGIEAGPGIKDPAKLEAFVGAARLIG